MVVTDLDGTLTHSAGKVCPAAIQTLHELGRGGIVRVVATGRTLFAACALLEPDFPIDYLVFSSGAGIFEWSTRTLLVAHHLTREQVAEVETSLFELELDFMLHRAIPDNHFFFYWKSAEPSHDFLLRCEKHRNFALPWNRERKLDSATQFLVVAPARHAVEIQTALRVRFPALSVIRATSPLSGAFFWLEIFSKSVSKSQGAAWLASERRILPKDILAVGNDYNDEDLLAWAGTGCIVGNAPEDLQKKFRRVRANHEQGFSHAVSDWLARQKGTDLLSKPVGRA